jgi:Phosphate-induced protein 1 conserved region
VEATKAAILIVLACLLFAAPKLAYGLQAAQPEADALAGVGGSHQTFFMPQDRCAQSSGGLGAGCAPVGYAAPGAGNVTNHGGPVMHSVTNYAIFWLPAGYHFDTWAIDRAYVNASDAGFEALVGQYLRDLSDTAYYSIVQQYTDSSGGPGFASKFGGAWLDTSQYPNSEGSRTNPLQDSDIESEVTKAMSANGWSAANGNSEFFVFTGQDVFGCAGDTCSYSGYCAYHSAFQAPDGQDVVYADIPDPGNSNAGSCLATSATSSFAPNGGAFADSAVNLVAHEGFEGVTDPFFNGWYYQNVDHEIADECVWKFGQVASDGSNIVLNGDKYLVQEMWSNKVGGCYIPPTVPTLKVVASYQALGGGSGFAPPTFTYFSRGVLVNTSLSASSKSLDVDSGSVWNVTDTLAGSTTAERWQGSQSSSGTLRSAGTMEFDYYHQYLVDFGFSVSGGGSGYFGPSVAVIQLGLPGSVSATTPGAAQGTWVDAQSNYTYAGQLPGSGADERWTARSAGGTSSAGPVDVLYYHQYLVPVSYEGGGAGSPPPVLQYSSLGGALETQLGQSPQNLWLDAGGAYSATDPLSGSTATQRWFAPRGDGTVSSEDPLELVYDQQYRLSVSGGFAVTAAPPSATGDGFYDAGSAVTVSSARTWDEAGLTRVALASYSLDGGSPTAVPFPEDGSGNFSAPPITLDGPHGVSFGSATQYLVGFSFTDATGSKAITPSSIQVETSQPNATVDVQGSGVWLYAGSTFVVGHLVWEGEDVSPPPQPTRVDAPQNVTVAAEVYDVTLKASDYLGVPVSGAAVDIRLANGTSVARTTGPDGTVSVASIPLGRFNATVSYLGLSQSVRADVAAQAGRAEVRVAASLPDLGASIGAAVGLALVAYAVLRRGRLP